MPNPTVIVVPGFLGSSLAYTGYFNQKRVLWLDQTNLLLRGPDPLDLAADGLSPGPLASGRLYANGYVQANIYAGLLNYLNSNGFQWLFFAYDWRVSILPTAALFAAYLRSAAVNGPFVVIGHSMGGLVSRLAYPIYASTGPTSNWLRSIHLCTPQGGSYSSAQSLAGQYSINSWLFTMANYVGLLGGSGIPSFLQGQSLQQRFAQVIASWPSLNEMLPTFAAPFTGVDPLVPELYQVATYQGQNAYVTQARLTAALATQAAIAALPTQPRPNEVSVIGVGTATAFQLEAINPLDANASYQFDTNGDGVVHADRAALAGANTMTLSISHQNAPSSSTFIANVVGLILNGLAGPETIATPPEPVSSFKPVIFTDPPKVAVNSTIPFPFINTRGDP